MGFNTVTFGIMLGEDHVDLESICRVCFKNITISYYDDKADEIFSPDRYGKLADHICDLVNNEIDIVALQYNDINGDEDDSDVEHTFCCGTENFLAGYMDLKYTYCPCIKIGAAHFCASMIHFGCVDEENCQIVITPSDLATLEEWRKKLIKEDRLSEDAKYGLVGNCCS